MNFEDLIKKGQVRKASKDVQLAKSLLEQTKQDIKFFNSLEINENSARKIISNYYDFLRSILEAMSAIDGYKIYNHESYAYYLLEKDEKSFSEKFDRFRKIRNNINYYGKSASVEEAQEIKEEIIKMIESLMNKYLKEVFKE